MKFPVGQRVRIKWSIGWPELAGKEGVVCPYPSPSDFPGGGQPSLRNKDSIPVAPTSWGTCVAPRIGSNGSAWFAPLEDQIEPIVYDGAAPSTWDACLWRPDGSHKKVAEEGRAIALRSIL